ncbi:MAG: ABC transporter permease [Chloroflexi bacterium]|nr:ABC transporter permease [Chloroflexota bacterium]
MRAYLLSRLVQLLPVVLVVIILNFLLIRMAPGDPVVYIIGDAPVSEELYRETRARLGLDRPIPEQLVIYLANVARGDLGYSFTSRAPVTTVIGDRLPATLLLMVSQFVVAIVAGVLFGVLSATRPGTLLDAGVTLLSVIGYSMPVFWLGQMLILVFSLQLDLFPAQGMLSLRTELSGLDRVANVLHHLILPLATLSLFNLALIARLTRANMLEVLTQEFVLFARAKGLSEETVLFRHALKNALLPVITIVGLNVRTLIAGAVLTETVFAWPGLGRLTYDAIFARDYPVLMGMFVIAGTAVVLANILTDLTYAYLDPRIRFG